MVMARHPPFNGVSCW